MVTPQEIIVLVKEVFQNQNQQPPSDQNACFGENIFLVEDALTEDYSDSKCRDDIVGYPSRPVYRELGNLLYIWMRTRKYPAMSLPKFELLSEKSYEETRSDRICQADPLLEGMLSLWDTWSVDERKYRIHEVFSILGVRGLLDLLGVRKTVGSLDIWPPPRQVLEAAARQRHSEKAELSVAARALAKHGHRDETASWWGSSTGTEKEKNEHADMVLKTILDGATWINIHQIVHGQQILEVRHADGYGARWNHDGKVFRGFLEPQMEGGHEIGWKH